MIVSVPGSFNFLCTFHLMSLAREMAAFFLMLFGGTCEERGPMIEKLMDDGCVIDKSKR